MKKYIFVTLVSLHQTHMSENQPDHEIFLFFSLLLCCIIDPEDKAPQGGGRGGDELRGKSASLCCRWQQRLPELPSLCLLSVVHKHPHNRNTDAFTIRFVSVWLCHS